MLVPFLILNWNLHFFHLNWLFLESWQKILQTFYPHHLNGLTSTCTINYTAVFFAYASSIVPAGLLLSADGSLCKQGLATGNNVEGF